MKINSIYLFAQHAMKDENQETLQTNKILYYGKATVTRLWTLNDTHCTLCILTKTLNKLFIIYMEFIFTFTFQPYKFF